MTTIDEIAEVEARHPQEEENIHQNKLIIIVGINLMTIRIIMWHNHRKLVVQMTEEK